jgi:ABC-type sugar transport system ATPase subunit
LSSAAFGRHRSGGKSLDSCGFRRPDTTGDDAGSTLGVIAVEPALAQSVGRTVAVGIRPEAISVIPGGQDGLRGAVVVSEELGSEVISHIEVSATSVRDEAIVEGLPEGTSAGAAPAAGGDR